jgi:hypothetical protein
MMYGASPGTLDNKRDAPLRTWYSHPCTSILSRITGSNSGITVSKVIDLTLTGTISLDLNASFAPVTDTALLSSRPTGLNNRLLERNPVASFRISLDHLENYERVHTQQSLQVENGR